MFNFKEWLELNEMAQIIRAEKDGVIYFKDSLGKVISDKITSVKVVNSDGDHALVNVTTLSGHNFQTMVQKITANYLNRLASNVSSVQSHRRSVKIHPMHKYEPMNADDINRAMQGDKDSAMGKIGLNSMNKQGMASKL